MLNKQRIEKIFRDYPLSKKDIDESFDQYRNANISLKQLHDYIKQLADETEDPYVKTSVAFEIVESLENELKRTNCVVGSLE